MLRGICRRGSADGRGPSGEDQSRKDDVRFASTALTPLSASVLMFLPFPTDEASPHRHATIGSQQRKRCHQGRRRRGGAFLCSQSPPLCVVEGICRNNRKRQSSAAFKLSPRWRTLGVNFTHQTRCGFLQTLQHPQKCKAAPGRSERD